MSETGGATSGTIVEYPSSSIVEYAPRLIDTPRRFDRWTSYVSQAGVRAIAVSPVSRTIWVATWGGVLAWDRGTYTYRRYSSEHGLAGPASCIAISNDDRPWIGYDAGGLSFFDGSSWRSYEHLRNERVFALATASNGGMWVATPGRISLVVGGQPPKDVTRSESEVSGARALLDDDGKVFVASPSGFFRASLNGDIERIGGDDLRECTALGRDAEGKVVVGTINGVIDGTGQRIEPENRESAVLAVLPSRKGVLVVTRSGLARVDNGRRRPLAAFPDGFGEPRGAAIDHVDEYLCIGTDAEIAALRVGGDTWERQVLPRLPEDDVSNLGRCSVSIGENAYVGTASGLFVGRPDGTWERDAEFGDVRSAVVARWEGKDELWVLSWPGGVFRFAHGSRSWRPVPISTGVLPRMLLTSRDGSPYVVDGSRLLGVRDGTVSHVSRDLPVDARVVIQSPESIWFAAGDRGLSRFHNSQWRLEPSLQSVPVFAFDVALFQLWIGARGALWTFVNNAWEHLPLEHEGVTWTEAVTAITHTRKHDALWIACGGRVAKLDLDTRKIVEVHDRFNSGVWGDTIVSLTSTDNALWVVSKSGIARYNFGRV